MCLKCYPSACSRYRCLRTPPPVVFICNCCGNPAFAGEYEDCFSVATPAGRVCGSCIHLKLEEEGA